MKRQLLIGLVIIVVVVALYAVIFIRPIFPGTYARIVYPASGADVPPEFSVEAVGTSWSFGIEIRHMLAGPTTHVSVRGSAVSLTVDDKPYANSGGGNHHLFSLSLPEGPHTIRLMTPFGEDSIEVNVTDNLHVRLERIDDVLRYTDAADRLRAALEEYLRQRPAPTEGDVGTDYRQVYLTDDGGFIFFGVMKEGRVTSCEVRFVDLADPPPTASDIASAVPFSWDEAGWERPVRISACDSCGDRFLSLVVDTDTLTIFCVYPDGEVTRTFYALSTLPPGFLEAMATDSYTEVVINCNGGYGVLKIWAGNGFFYLVLDNGAILPVKDAFGGSEALILENGAMVSGGGIYAEYATFESLYSERGQWSPVYLPLSAEGNAYSITSGYPAYSPDEFSPVWPRFDMHPFVPGQDPAASPVSGGGGPVRFPPGIVGSIVGEKEQYFRVIPQGPIEGTKP